MEQPKDGQNTPKMAASDQQLDRNRPVDLYDFVVMLIEDNSCYSGLSTSEYSGERRHFSVLVYGPEDITTYMRSLGRSNRWDYPPYIGRVIYWSSTYLDRVTDPDLKEKWIQMGYVPVLLLSRSVGRKASFKLLLEGDKIIDLTQDNIEEIIKNWIKNARNIRLN